MLYTQSQKLCCTLSSLYLLNFFLLILSSHLILLLLDLLYAFLINFIKIILGKGRVSINDKA